jgi:hypothetical protein
LRNEVEQFVPKRNSTGSLRVPFCALRPSGRRDFLLACRLGFGYNQRQFFDMAKTLLSRGSARDEAVSIAAWKLLYSLGSSEKRTGPRQVLAMASFISRAGGEVLQSGSGGVCGWQRALQCVFRPKRCGSKWTHPSGGTKSRRSTMGWSCRRKLHEMSYADILAGSITSSTGCAGSASMQPLLRQKRMLYYHRNQTDVPQNANATWLRPTSLLFDCDTKWRTG